MAGETSVSIVGNLTADPELRYTQNGLAVANMTIASTPRVWDRTKNEFVDGEALFLRASIWREYAENAAATLSKGSRVIAIGVLKQRSYETKEGEKRTSIELELEEIGPALRFVKGSLAKSDNRGAGQGGGGQSAGPREPEPSYGGGQNY